MTGADVIEETFGVRGLLIGADWVHRASGGSMPHINPANGLPQSSVVLAGEPEISEAVAVARRALPAWRALAATERRRLLLRISERLLERASDFGEIAIRELGTPRTIAPAAATVAADWFTYYGGWVDKANGEVLAGENFDYTLPEPYGVIAAIVPWNAPLMVAAQKVAPALAAGNCVILKPPELAPFACLELGQLCLDAGLPPGVLQVLPGDAVAGAALVRHPGIDKISFTGGTAVGADVAAAAGAALKPVVMELGGKSANILFEDADLDQAVPLSIGLISVFSGQGCALPTRLLVQDTIYDEVLNRATRFAEGIVVGDPSELTTAMGPVISAGHCARIERIIDEAVTTRAGKLLTGGTRLGGMLAGGYYIPPTLFADVDNASPLAQDEIFGPVLAITRFKTEEDAVALANDTQFGLAAYIQTNDLRRAHRVADSLEAGFISINSRPNVTPATPFGGFRASGFGKEGGYAGLAEFIRVKNVTVAR